METESVSPVAPPRRRKKSKLVISKEVVGGKAIDVVAETPAFSRQKSAESVSSNSTALTDSQPTKLLSPSQCRAEGPITTVTASDPTTLSCKTLGEASSDRAATRGKEDDVITRSVPVKSESFKLHRSTANSMQEGVKKPQRPPPYSPSMHQLSPKTDLLYRSMMTVSNSDSKDDNIYRSCSVEELSSKVSFSDNFSTEMSVQQTPVRPTRKSAKPNCPKQTSSSESSSTALQLAYSSKNRLGSSPSASKSVQNEQFTIINSREKHFEKKQSKDVSTGDKMRVSSSTLRSFRPLHHVKESFTTKDSTVTSSVLSKAHSLISKVKARTLPRSGPSSAQLKPTPPEKPPKPASPSSSGPIYETIKDVISARRPQPNSEGAYSYVDMSSGWKDKYLNRSQKWSELQPKSKCASYLLFVVGRYSLLW